MTKGRFDAAVVVAAHTGSVDLGLEQAEDVGAKGHDGRRELLLRCCRGELGGRVVHEGTGIHRRGEFFEGGVQADCLEVEELGSGH